MRARTPTQQQLVQTYYDAAMRRLHAAQDVRGHSHTPVALGLYRQGVLLIAGTGSKLAAITAK